MSQTAVFGEPPNATGDCCDVCLQNNASEVADFKEEPNILIDALNHVGCKGEAKVTEWIRGSHIAWTNESYGNRKGKDVKFWRAFIKQCHVVSLVQLELRSMIKSSGMYAVNGVYYATQRGIEALSKTEPLLLPTCNTGNSNSQSGRCWKSLEIKKKRVGKGSNILTVVRRLLSEPENWMKVVSKSTSTAFLHRGYVKLTTVLKRPSFHMEGHTAF